MKDPVAPVATAPSPASPAKTQFRYLGGVGSLIQFRVLLTQMDTVKPQEVMKKGRIVEFSDPLKVVEMDDKGRDGKTVDVPLKDLVSFLSPDKA